MKQLLAGLLFMFSFAVGASAQSTTPITVGQTGPVPAFFMHPNIYALPLTIGGNTGTVWFYPQACFSGPCGFILFRPNLEGPDYVTAQVTAWTAVTFNAIGQVTQAMVAYTVQADPNNDNDTDTVMGSFTLNFSYTFIPGTGRGAGWKQSITGGAGAQSITHD